GADAGVEHARQSRMRRADRGAAGCAAAGGDAAGKRVARRVRAGCAQLLVCGGYVVAVVAPTTRGSALKTVKIVAAIVLLNSSLTFQNRWPTPAIRWQTAFSVELAALLLALAMTSQWRGRPSRLLLNILAALFVVLAISRYAFVTAPALYGRDVNLYWDMRFVPDVAAMLTRAAPLWIVVSIAVGAVLVFALLFAVLRWALA